MTLALRSLFSHYSNSLPLTEFREDPLIIQTFICNICSLRVVIGTRVVPCKEKPNSVIVQNCDCAHVIPSSVSHYNPFQMALQHGLRYLGKDLKTIDCPRDSVSNTSIDCINTFRPCGETCTRNINNKMYHILELPKYSLVTKSKIYSGIPSIVEKPIESSFSNESPMNKNSPPKKIPTSPSLQVSVGIQCDFGKKITADKEITCDLYIAPYSDDDSAEIQHNYKRRRTNRRR